MLSYDRAVMRGRLSIDSVGRLVERERASSLQSKKAELTSECWTISQDATENDDGCENPLTASMNVSLAETAFAMELDECDVDLAHSIDRSEDRLILKEVCCEQSPYCYSYCAFSSLYCERRTAYKGGAMSLDATA